MCSGLCHLNFYLPLLLALMFVTPLTKDMLVNERSLYAGTLLVCRLPGSSPCVCFQHQRCGV